MSLYAKQGILIAGTLVCLFNQIYKEAASPECGAVDSLKTLIMHEHFIELYSEEHILVILLIEAFRVFNCNIYPVLYV